MLTNSSTAFQASLAHPVQKAFLKCIQRRLRRTGFLLNLALAQLWYRTPTFHDSFHSWWIQSSPVLVHLFQSNMSLYGSKMGYECCFMLNSTPSFDNHRRSEVALNGEVGKFWELTVWIHKACSRFETYPKALSEESYHPRSESYHPYLGVRVVSWSGQGVLC